MSNDIESALLKMEQLILAHSQGSTYLHVTKERYDQLVELGELQEQIAQLQARIDEICGRKREQSDVMRVTIIRVTDGKAVTIEESRDDVFSWRDGNYSCDCNRGDRFNAALGLPDEDYGCGNELFYVPRFDDEMPTIPNPDARKGERKVVKQ